MWGRTREMGDPMDPVAGPGASSRAAFVKYPGRKAGLFVFGKRIFAFEKLLKTFRRDFLLKILAKKNMKMRRKGWGNIVRYFLLT